MEPIPPIIKFAPAIPFPDPFVPERRIKQLRHYLAEANTNDSIPLAGQQSNILAAIKSYEEGVIDGSQGVKTFFVNGKIVSKDEAYKGYGHLDLLTMSGKFVAQELVLTLLDAGPLTPLSFLVLAEPFGFVGIMVYFGIWMDVMGTVVPVICVSYWYLG
ncbi:hypothetical protein VE01_08418 [Pseudogymnoascus verrucosus]|uniref:Uncharacterized protein n=1 Tax=Pseudogymnoascus verrucosus TaxID=342668 RepID=A0A1B8GBU5_9PEZI|nr:uncharacterized protein VE01_08418 [Pseudogymnoascus verrucosus]OBT93319.1 hypothetical protein VE01_08418 [Pseudogymnoascus verrucosus]